MNNTTSKLNLTDINRTLYPKTAGHSSQAHTEHSLGQSMVDHKTSFRYLKGLKPYKVCCPNTIK